MNADLKAEKRGRALVLTIDREAKRNALSGAVVEGIAEGLTSDDYLAQLEYEREAFRRDQNAARRFARSIVGQFR
jgi:hypothetical protein